jgi:hypothetical protein
MDQAKERNEKDKVLSINVGCNRGVSHEIELISPSRQSFVKSN